MSSPKTLGSVERRWERRAYCLTILPMIALMLLAFAIGRSLSESVSHIREYWNR